MKSRCSGYGANAIWFWGLPYLVPQRRNYYGAARSGAVVVKVFTVFASSKIFTHFVSSAILFTFPFLTSQDPIIQKLFPINKSGIIPRKSHYVLINDDSDLKLDKIV